MDNGQINELLDKLKELPSEQLESDEVEFKAYKDTRAIHNASRQLVEEITAMANCHGGVIIIGIMDSSDVKNQNWASQLIGIEELDCLEAKKRILGNIQSDLSIDVSNHKYADQNFVVIQVPESRSGLIMTAAGKCYIRSGRDSIPMSPDQVREKVLSAPGYDWSAELIQINKPLDALDLNLIEEALEEYKNYQEMGSTTPPIDYFLETIGVLSNGELTRAGLLFLGKPDLIKEHFSNSEYRFTKREAGGKLELNEVWSGSLWEAIKKVRELFDEVQEYRQFEFESKKYTYPIVSKDAFEEAFVNSLVHRDYARDGLTTIEFSPSLVTFVNPGNFYGGITSANIFSHPPRQRNKTLADIFMKFGLVDRAGMGTRRMNIASMKLGREKPVFGTDDGHVFAVLQLDTVKEGIFAISSSYEDYDVPELFLINLIYGKGVVPFDQAEQKLAQFEREPKKAIISAVSKLECIHLGVSKSEKGEIFLVVADNYKIHLNAYEKFDLSDCSKEIVLIYSYLVEKDQASSNELAVKFTLDSPEMVSNMMSSYGFFSKNSAKSVDYWSLK